MSEFPENPTFDDPSLTLLWNSFVLRLYCEAQTGSWRGEVLHLQSKEKGRIATLAQLYAFLKQHTPGLEENNDGSVQPANESFS